MTLGIDLIEARRPIQGQSVSAFLRVLSNHLVIEYSYPALTQRYSMFEFSQSTRDPQHGLIFHAVLILSGRFTVLFDGLKVWTAKGLSGTRQQGV